jgi:hypothetical protein
VSITAGSGKSDWKQLKLILTIIATGFAVETNWGTYSRLDLEIRFRLCTIKINTNLFFFPQKKINTNLIRVLRFETTPRAHYF